MRIILSFRIAAAVAALSLFMCVFAVADEKQDKEKLNEIKSGLVKIEARLLEFDTLYKKCQAKGIRLDYPTVTKTMLKQFIPFAKEDLENKCIWRSEFAVKDMSNSLDQSIAAMKAYLKDPNLAPKVRRYQTSKLDIKGLSLIGDRKDSSGKIDRGPIFFVGYGHFNEVRENMPNWPGYGINIMQFAEFGPTHVLTEENKVDLGMVNLLKKTLDEAAKRNIKVDVLLSPHYFPEWAKQKWPALHDGGGGFIGFNVDAPEAKYVIEKYLRIVVPLIKDYPALNSFCLSNEPTLQNMAGAHNTRSMWNDYLIKIHGDINKLNEHYGGTNYKSFDEVPVPGNEAYNDPQYYDWCVFNQERFAAWHSWMADICRELAPNVPVHTKMQPLAFPHRQTIAWGVDPELFNRFSDIFGNDGGMSGNPDPGWSMPFHYQNINYDLQRSVSQKPIFDSENHPLDVGGLYKPPDHFRNAFWQGAIHGQAATTIWVWQRAKPWLPNAEQTFIGQIIDRPGGVEATGMTCLDLNRFAEEVTALQNVKAPVAVLFSLSSISKTWDYIYGVLRFYTALNSCGVKIDFITERQVIQGKLKDYKMIVAPYAMSVQPSTIEALKNLPASTKLVLSGNSLEINPYNKPYPTEELAGIRAKALTINGPNPNVVGQAHVIDSSVIFPLLYDELANIGGLSEYSVVDVATGKPVWGVEWLPAKVGNRTVINMANQTDKPVTIKVLFKGKEVRVNDLFSLGGKEKAGQIKPMQVVLAEVVK